VVNFINLQKAVAIDSAQL